MIFADIAEEKLKNEIAKRTRKEWIKLYIRRSILAAINVIFLGGCSYGIIITNLKKDEVAEWANE